MNAMNLGPKTTVGEKGSDSFTRAGVEDDRVAFFTKLVRGLNEKTRQDFITSIAKRGARMLQEGRNTEGYKYLVDLFVMMFETRDINEGKGERDLFYGMLCDMFIFFPEEVLSMLRMVPDTFGSWLDFNKIWMSCHSDPKYTRLVSEIERMYCEQLMQDDQLPPGNTKVSLAGKWAPREKSASKEMARSMALHLFPVLNEKKPHEAVAHSMKQYRQLLVRLNERLKTVEVNMCSGTWREIKPGAVPAGNLSKHRKAFMNEVIKGKNKGQERSTDQDRRTCATNFKTYLEECKKNPTKVKVHGRNLHPHQLVGKYWNPTNGHRQIGTEDAVLEAQFADLKQKFLEKGGNLCKTVVLADTSGSMHSRSCHDYLTGKSNENSVEPILPCIALTALITQINHPAFRNCYIRFSSTAAWKNYGENASLRQIVDYMAHDNDWGGSTNLASALDLILKTCIEHKVPEGDIPDLLILSDMQFDTARGANSGGYYNQRTKQKPSDFETHYQSIQRCWKEAGYSRAPTIRFWNLAANTKDFPAHANSHGVEIYSGFSANLLKHFMEDDLDGYKEPDPPTPYETMRKVLDDERYDIVRAHLSNLKQGAFADYTWSKVPICPKCEKEMVEVLLETEPPQKAYRCFKC
jgi:hypothetical protein